MAAVAGVFLDPVDHKLSDGDAVLPHPLAQVQVFGQRSVGRGLFAFQVGVGGVDDGLVRDRAVEVPVGGSVRLR